MHSLLYSSAAVRPMTTEDLTELLTQCRRNNARRGVTGMLLYRDGSFMQYLEGERDVLFDLFDNKIFLDERHTAVTLYFDRRIAVRSFDGWSMGFRNLDDVDAHLLEGFSPFLEQGFSLEATPENTSLAMRILALFREENVRGQ